MRCYKIININCTWYLVHMDTWNLNLKSELQWEVRVHFFAWNYLIVIFDQIKLQPLFHSNITIWNSRSVLVFYLTWLFRKVRRVIHKRWDYFGDLRPSLKNLSRGLNLRRSSNMVGSTSNFFQCSKFKSALNWNRFLVDLRRSLN